MTTEERQLITSLFDRLRSFGRPEKDKQAEALIQSICRCHSRCTVHACAIDADPRAGA